jgi:hypothetical protein
MRCNPLLTKAIACWAFVAVLLAVAGCSRSTGTVSGKVTFQDQPLPAGSVSFVHADGTTVSGSIQEGNYSIDKVPTGPCTILVVSLPLPRSMWNPQQKQGVGGDVGSSDKLRKGIAIPARYGDPKQSDLHYEVTSGRQNYPIDLKP